MGALVDGPIDTVCTAMSTSRQRYLSTLGCRVRDLSIRLIEV